MISKELLSEVLEENISEVYKIGSNPNFKQNTLLFKLYGCGELCNINIYELAHKCKEWASKQYYSVMSGWEMTHWGGAYHVVLYKNPNSILFSMSTIETEPEAIFKACQWILDNKDIK